MNFIPVNKPLITKADIDKVNQIFNKKVPTNIKLHFVLENKVLSINDMLEFIKDIGPLKKLVLNYKSFLELVS